MAPGFEPRAPDRPVCRLADLEIELRAAAASAVTRGGDRVPGGDFLPDSLVEPFIMSVEAHVAVPMIDDGEQPEPGQPVGVD